MLKCIMWYTSGWCSLGSFSGSNLVSDQVHVFDYCVWQLSKGLASTTSMWRSFLTFLKITTQVALQAYRWVLSTWNHHFCEMKYNNYQPIPSPSGMSRFKDNEVATPWKVFLGKSTMVPEEIPDFTGSRVEQYAHLIYFTIYIGHVECCFRVAK